MLRILFFLTILTVGTQLSAQSVTGTWKTIDDATNEAKSHLELTLTNGKLNGKVTKLLKSAPDKICTECPDERKGQKIMGMTVVEGLYLKDGFYQGGRILDPEKGKWYSCKMWLKDGDPNVMVVRGSVGPFYRTQYWYRVF
jgi:uncharacterized protein (DUF2147 family)